ncbi:MAG: hypothetical protein AAFX99_05280 [Myxococcota bacterium]
MLPRTSAAALTLVMTAAALLFPSTPQAQEGKIVVPGFERQLRDLSVTVSPLLLFAPMAELTGEVRLNDQLGAAVIGGLGLVDDDDGDSFFMWALGGQLRYYVLGNFEHGSFIGAELHYIGSDADNADLLLGRSPGLAVSPFVGYKFVGATGFTFDAQIGPQAQFESNTSTTGDENGDSGTELGLMLNINVGWSF